MGRVESGAMTRRTPKLRWGALGTLDYFADRRREITHARARDDDRVAAAVRFLRNPQEFSTIVFPEFYVEMLPLDLQFLRLDDIIHFLRRGESRPRQSRIGSINFTQMLPFPRRPLPAFWNVGEGEIDLPFEWVNPRHKHAQVIPNRKAFSRLPANQCTLGRLKDIKIISQ